MRVLRVEISRRDEAIERLVGERPRSDPRRDVIDIDAAAGPGGSPQVKVFHTDGTLVRTITAYDAAFSGGVFVAAGFDSFALRVPEYARQIQIFEIDHPATQELKLRRIRECGITAAPTVHFIAANLAEQSVADALARRDDLRTWVRTVGQFLMRQRVCINVHWFTNQCIRESM